MRRTIHVGDRFMLCYAFDCDTNREYFDVYEIRNEKGTLCENYIGELEYDDVEDNLIDEDTGEYDVDGLEILCEDLFD